MSKKIRILISAIIIVLIAIISVFAYINQTDKNNINAEQMPNKRSDKNINQCYYKSFDPIYNGDYNYFGEVISKMENQDLIYNIKIDNFEEYKNYKEKWPEMIEISQQEFEKYYCVITAIENTSMQGLVVDNIEFENEKLYISLIKEDDENTYNCISYMIPRKFETDKIITVRNINESEKEYIEGMKIALSNVKQNNSDDNSIDYLTQGKIDLNGETQNSNNYWQDELYFNYKITKDMEEPKWSKFIKLNNNGMYYLKVDKFSEYIKLKDKYNFRDLNYTDFKYMTPYLIINRTIGATLSISDKYDGNDYINKEIVPRTYVVKNSDIINAISSNNKYDVILILIPNNSQYENHFIAYENPITISKERAIEIAKEKIKTMESINGKKDFESYGSIKLENVYKNDFPSSDNIYEPNEYKERKYTCWKFSSYSISDPLAMCEIYIDAENGEFIGGKMSGD